MAWLTGQIRSISRFLNGPKKCEKMRKKKKVWGVVDNDQEKVSTIDPTDELPKRIIKITGDKAEYKSELVI
jgi:hypothetical protein